MGHLAASNQPTRAGPGPSADRAQRTRRSTRARPARAAYRRDTSRQAEPNVVRPIVEHPAPHLGELLHPVDDREEVVAGERAGTAGERYLPVREQELGLADAPWVPEQLT